MVDAQIVDACLCCHDRQQVIFDGIRYNSPFAYMFTRAGSGVVTDFGVSNIVSGGSNLHVLESIYDSMGTSCGIRIESIGVPLPSDMDLSYKCGDLPAALTFSGISCSAKEFEYFGACLQIGAADPICSDLAGIKDPVQKFIATLNAVTFDSLPKYLSSVVAKLLYSNVKVCDGTNSTTYNFLQYSANSIFAPADLDMSVTGPTYDGVLKLLVEYGSITDYSTRNLVIVMDSLNFAAFNASFRAKSNANNCCHYTSMYIKDGLHGNAPTIENIRVFDYEADGVVTVIVNNRFPFKKSDDGKPLLPVFNLDLIGFKMDAAYPVIDWNRVDVPQLSSHRIVHAGAFKFGLRTAANDINNTPGVKMALDMMFGVFKLSAFGQFFIKGKTN